MGINKPITFTVIIPVYNNWEDLQLCLDALEEQSYDKELFEIIVVDNASTTPRPDWHSLPLNARIISEAKLGSYAARNTGASVASGDLLAFTDSDCIPDRKWLANAEKCFNRSACDLIGGEVEIFQSKEENKYGYLYESVTAFPQYKHVPAGKGVTANLFVNKSVFNEMDGFRSTIKSGGDWEFTLRCTEKGFEMIYCENVIVLHPARTLTNIFKKEKRMACGGALSVKDKYGYSYLRILGSHLIHGPKYKRKDMPRELSGSEKAVIYSLDTLKYLYRMLLYSGLFLRLINPNKIRE